MLAERGVTGATGPVGPKGSLNLAQAGTWNFALTYTLGDAVGYDGFLFVTRVHGLAVPSADGMSQSSPRHHAFARVFWVVEGGQQAPI